MAQNLLFIQVDYLKLSLQNDLEYSNTPAHTCNSLAFGDTSELKNTVCCKGIFCA